MDARAWTTGEGPKALFDAAVGWLRERRVLLPGVTTLARPLASVREAANQRLWDSLYGLPSTGQPTVLDALPTVPPGTRVSESDGRAIAVRGGRQGVPAAAPRRFPASRTRTPPTSDEPHWAGTALPAGPWAGLPAEKRLCEPLTPPL
ncbi:DUF4158 domain-containing protein [Saccharothrix violaceirubra]|uniref:DUF4158 domain-containing protein n=1 Tax=Saccharothrix violaceirubra TaxID=413306 RepID=UPI001C872F0C